MNPQARIHMLLPHQDHDRAKVFDFCCLALELGLTLASEHGLPHEAIPGLRVELVVEMLNVSPYHCKVSIWCIWKNVVHKHIQSAAQQMLINAKMLAVHPVWIEG